MSMNMNDNMSYWQDTINHQHFEPLKENIKVNTLVIGGGIAGITTAYLLNKSGVDTVIVDGSAINKNTTSKTTAKITYQHSAIYSDLISQVGKEKTFQYLDANRQAIALINKTINDHNISCDYKTQTAFLYASKENEIGKLIKEKEAYESLGIKPIYSQETQLPFEVISAIGVESQGQFHPLKYIYSIAKILTEKGCQIYENTRVLDIEGEKPPFKVITENNEIVCDNVVVACHYPFLKDGKHGMYFLRLYQSRSYVLGIRDSTKPFEGMYINIKNPIYSLRYQFDEKGALLLLGGGNHRTAEKEDERKSYEELKNFGSQYLQDPQVEYTWSNQDCMTLDDIPYIGQMSSNIPGIYVATGFKKWGMTSGTAAGMIISDLIVKGENPNADVFYPSRFSVIDSAKNFIINGLEIAESFIMRLLPINIEELKEVEVGEGKIIEYKGSKIGVYKTENGKIEAIIPNCTHLGCLLKFNKAEKTWDCTCHGSRFSVSGKVLEGPAILPLKKVEIQQEEEKDKK